MTLDNSYPETFNIDYDVALDGKLEGDILDAKFFIYLFPSEADNKYFLKTLGNGLSYSAGVWSVSHDQRDLDAAAATGKAFYGCLAIQYSGETYFREVKGDRLLENGSPMKINILQNAAE